MSDDSASHALFASGFDRQFWKPHGVARGYHHSLTFDRDSLSIGGSPLGNLSLHIIEREAPKTIKMEGQGAPVALNMWIQLLPIDAMTCKLRVTVRAELNMFIKAMVSKPLQSGVENIANILASIPYNS